MSKELPFFKFYPSEWFEGDITLQNEKTQGLFVLICAWYWKKDCVVDLKFINKRLIDSKASLKQCLNNLIDSEIIKVDDNQRIVINFLDQQYDELSEKRKKLVDAGRKGGKASLKHRRSNKEIEVDKDKEIKEREYIEKDFLPIFERWLKYKKDKRQSYKNEDSIKAAYNKLYKLAGGDFELADKIVEQSLANNWDGLFELKDENKKDSTRILAL